MRRFRRILAAARLWPEDSGATAIEYALVAGFVSIVVAGAVNSIGQGILVNFYDKILAALTH